MRKIDGKSFDLDEYNIFKLSKFFERHKEDFFQIFPEIESEGKIDFEKLKLILGENIEDSEERYNFTWNGKKDAIRLSQTPTTGTLRPDKENSKNWDETQNLYIEGDNLEVLKILQKSYHEKIKMIYIDPPYNTGKDFVYKDDYRNNIKNYLEFTDQVDEEGKKLSTNAETSGRYHTDWLNMMYPRLRLARNLLAEDGVIFISIDDNEVHNLRKICDEVFGESNFIAQLIWQKKFSRSNDAKYFSTMHDYILCYAKNNIKNSSTGWEIGLLPREEEIPSSYSNPDNDNRGVWTSVVLSAKSGSDQSLYKIKTPSGREVYPPSGRYWSCSKETFNKWVEEGRIWFGIDGDAIPRKKTFLSEVQSGLRPNTILLHEDYGHNQEGKQETKKLFDNIGVFDGPKPVRLLGKILTIANLQKNDIILDFFSGSATTAHAVMDLNAEDGGNRKYIMVQLPEPTDEKSEAFKSGYKTIADIGRERIRRAGEKILEDNKDKNGIEDLDIGFKSFKLDSSNIKEWNPEYIDKESDLLDLVNNFVEGREEKDILYEIILKYGIDLTTPIEENIINNKKIYNVGFGSVYIVLDNNIDNSVVEKIIDLNREYNMPNPIVVFKDNGFENDEIKLNAKLTLQDNGIEEVVSI